jgi:hypothetical protein
MVLMVSVIFAQKFKTLCRVLGKPVAPLLHVKEIECIVWQCEAAAASQENRVSSGIAQRRRGSPRYPGSTLYVSS